MGTRNSSPGDPKTEPFTHYVPHQETKHLSSRTSHSCDDDIETEKHRKVSRKNPHTLWLHLFKNLICKVIAKKHKGNVRDRIIMFLFFLFLLYSFFPVFIVVTVLSMRSTLLI